MLRVDLRGRDASLGSPTPILIHIFGLIGFRAYKFFGILKFKPPVFDLLKIRPYDFRSFVVRSLLKKKILKFDVNL